MKQEIITEIEQQIALTEKRGEKVVKYLEMFKGQSIFNDIALAIEFGYQLKLEEVDVLVSLLKTTTEYEVLQSFRDKVEQFKKK